MVVSFIDGRKRDTNRKLYISIIIRIQEPTPDILVVGYILQKNIAIF